LREKLIDGDMVLETVHGQGYRLNSLVTVESISRLEQ
jgi:hypothetical protein